MLRGISLRERVRNPAKCTIVRHDDRKKCDFKHDLELYHVRSMTIHRAATATPTALHAFPTSGRIAMLRRSLWWGRVCVNTRP